MWNDERTISSAVCNGTIVAPTREIELHVGIGVVIRFSERI